MQVVNKSLLHNILQQYPAVEPSIMCWFTLVQAADWQNDKEVKTIFPLSVLTSNKVTTELIPNRCFITYSINYLAKTIILDSLYLAPLGHISFSSQSSTQKKNRSFTYIWDEQDYEEAITYLLHLCNKHPSLYEKIETLAEIIDVYESERWPISHPSPRHLASFCKQQNNKKAKQLSALLKVYEDINMPFTKKVICTFKSAWYLSREWHIPLGCLLEWEMSVFKPYLSLKTTRKRS